MNTIERQGRIVDTIQAKGRITVADICRLFDVSEMTARRDLNELDRQGLLRRVHGGAIANLGRSYEPPFQSRSTKNQSAKEAIGRQAADYVYDGDSIAIDVGTTTLEMIKWLKTKRNLTIVASSLQIANSVVNTLALETDVRLILTGGIVRPRELSMVGHIPEQVYRDLHVDKAFIGIGGISLEDGMTEYNIEDTRIKQMLIKSAREKIVLADGSKFGLTTFATVGPLALIDHLITDQSAPSDIVAELRKKGVDVIVAG